MLSVKGLTKRYGDRAVVDNLTFEIKSGEVVGFLGPNGAGKTTTMNMLTGVLAPTGGMVEVDGLDTRRHPLEAARHIGYLPDTPPLYPEMTVRSYLEFVYRLKGVSAADKKAHMDEACQAADVTDVLPRVIGHLSRGYRQRVGLAAALIGDPDILILDEPTVGLDPRQIRDIRALIANLGRSRCILISTHILPEVSALCSRVLVLHKGIIVADGAPTELSPDRDGELCVIRVADGNAAKAIKLLTGIPDVTECRSKSSEESGCVDIEAMCARDVRPALMKALTGAGIEVFALNRARQGLEDAFLSLTLSEPGEKPRKGGNKNESRIQA